MDKLMAHYDIKKAVTHVYPLSVDYKLTHHQGAERWRIGSTTHVKEAIIKFEDLLGTYFGDQGTESKYTLPKFISKEKKVPMSNGPTQRWTTLHCWMKKVTVYANNFWGLCNGCEL